MEHALLWYSTIVFRIRVFRCVVRTVQKKPPQTGEKQALTVELSSYGPRSSVVRCSNHTPTKQGLGLAETGQAPRATS